MLRFPWRFLLISLFTAWAFDYLFWQKPAGISFLLLVGVVLLGAFLLSAGEQVRFSKKNIPLLAAALLTAFMILLRQEPLTMAAQRMRQPSFITQASTFHPASVRWKILATFFLFVCQLMCLPAARKHNLPALFDKRPAPALYSPST